MSIQDKPIKLLAVVAIALSSIATGHAWAGDVTQHPRTKQLIEEADTKNVEAAGFFQLGAMQYKRRDFKGVEEAMLQALRFDRSISKAYYLLGNALFEQGKIEGAIFRYEQAISLNPKMIYAYNNLGVALSRQGRYSEAIAQYEEAMLLNPSFPTAFSNMGIALYESDRPKEAVLYLEKAKNLFLQSGNLEQANEINKYLQCTLVPSISRRPRKLKPLCSSLYRLSRTDSIR